MNLLEILQKHESELDNCFQEIEELKNALYSKDKLVSYWILNKMTELKYE